MTWLRLLDDADDPEVRRRRTRLYVTAFLAIGMAFYSKALRFEEGESQALACLVLLSLLAFMTAAMALSLIKTGQRNGPKAARPTKPAGLVALFKRSGSATVESTAEAVENLQNLNDLRASRRGRLPSFNLDELSTALKEPEGPGARSDPNPKAPRQAAEKQQVDPWSKMLSDLTGQDQAKRRKSK